jgi:hypothetical protein
MANAPIYNNRDEVELPVAQQDMRFCGAQLNKKCLKRKRKIKNNEL